jgi:DNA helicase II / ATP-dependent DNA helicase PcrA
LSASNHGLAVHRVTAAAMAERAVELLGQRLTAGSEPGHLAVLARVNSALLPVQVALTEAGIPHTGPLDATVLGRTGVRTALAYLRLGLDTERIRREDVFDTINRPARKVKSAVQPLLGKRARFSMGQLEQVADSLGETHRDRFREYLGDLRGLEAAITDQADTARCLWIIRNRIGLGEAMDALDASRSRPEGSSHGDDLDALEQLAALQPDPAGFRDWLVDRLRVPGDPTGVTLSSVHRVKGMEWRHVVVFAANQGLFPHRLADDVEEERRVFHVAVTRCQQQVDVIADKDRASPFVAELTTPADRASVPETGPMTPPAPAAATRGEDGTVVAVRGLRVTVTGGFTGTLTDVARDHAVVTVAKDVVLRVPFGQPVTIEDAPTRLVKAPTRPRARSAAGGRLLDLDDAPMDAPMDDELFEALRSWRKRIASEAGFPPYIVFRDETLAAVARRKPVTLRELAACPGVGPTKLERYGDDVLDLVASHP